MHVVIKGKNLKKAFHFGEKKLNKWPELSKEEVWEVSTELRQNLKDLDEYVDEVKETFKEEFKQHAAFVTDSILVQLLEISSHNKGRLFSI